VVVVVVVAMILEKLNGVAVQVELLVKMAVAH
jgi:hypothetical protein